MDDLIKKMAEMTKEEREAFLNQAATAKKQIDTQEKKGEKEENDDRAIYEAFKNALRIYETPARGERETTGMCFYRDRNPVYFYTLDTNVYNPITKKTEWTTEVKYIAPSNLYPNFTELKAERSRDFLRRMVEGETIIVKNPETNQSERYAFNRRVYDKMTNTVKVVDDKTFNLLSLKSKLNPEYDADTKQECPPLLRALMASISGNVITWNSETEQWDQSKAENQSWFERWLYAVVHTRVGDPQLPVPIIFGKGKSGKNALCEFVIPGILGAQVCFSGVWDLINSNFNQFKLGKVFMFVDEAPERSEWSLFKNQTGSVRNYVKVKYGTEFEIDNCISWMVGSNHENYPFPVEDGKQMIRVSPMKIGGGSTFAENTVKILTQLHGADYCKNILEAAGLKVDLNDEFAVGDTLLRGPLHDAWTGREVLQQFINYLDQNYRKEGDGFYYLEPLRGQDWEDIQANRKSSVEMTAEYITEHNTNIVTINELYEIYKVLQNERHNNDQKRIQHLANFSSTIKPMMEERGWSYKRNNMIANGTSPDLYERGMHSYGDFRKYSESFDNYIVETDVPNGKIRRLKAIDIQAKMAENNLKIQDQLFGRIK